jgi:hypothetical protein
MGKFAGGAVVALKSMADEAKGLSAVQSSLN